MKKAVFHKHCKIQRILLFCSAVLLLLSALYIFPVKADKLENSKNQSSTSIHWNDALKQGPDWYGCLEAVRIGDNLLAYQRNEGGWYKYTDENQGSTDKAAVLTQKMEKEILNDKKLKDSTIDNKATYTELRYLAKVYTATKIKRFMDGFNKGLDALLKSQYQNGGWPQFLTDKSLYRAHITYNDDAMTNVLYLMKDIADGNHSDFVFVDPVRRNRAKEAVAKGIECILKTQIRVQGKLIAWCAQHDENTLLPAKARSYELESITSYESVGIVRFLMGLNHPSPEVIESIQSAVTWFKTAKLTGVQLIKQPDPTKPKGWDILIVSNPNAQPLWARFYEIETNRPFFCGRDGIKKYNLSEIEYERRVGYSWYNSKPMTLIENDYPEWQRGIGIYQ